MAVTSKAIPVNGKSPPIGSAENGVDEAKNRLNDYICKIPRAGLLCVLKGVEVATKSSPQDIATVVQCVSSLRMPWPQDPATDVGRVEPNGDSSKDAYALQEWHDALLDCLKEERAQCIATLAVSVAHLRQHSRETQCARVDPEVMDQVWSMIYGVLTSTSLDPPLCTAVRSAQGFLAVALCSLVEDGNIDELFRLHVWHPNDKRPQIDRSVHSHQPFAQSWILAGEGTDIRYDVEDVESVKTATHAHYALAWSDGKTLSSTYKTHQTVSVIANTGVFVKATPSVSAVHSRDMTYDIPSSKFHASAVPPGILHATLFFFDSQRGFDKNASVLGPVHGKSFSAHRDPAGITAAALAHLVQDKRLSEIRADIGRMVAQQGKLYQASEAVSNPIKLCENTKTLLNRQDYKELARAELNNVVKKMSDGRERGRERCSFEARKLPISARDVSYLTEAE